MGERVAHREIPTGGPRGDPDSGERRDLLHGR
jgi:hypothetical protein